MTEERAQLRCDHLALWIQEAAERPWREADATVIPVRADVDGESHLVAIVRRVGLLTLALVAGLQYVYVDTLLEIELLRPLIVFVRTGVAA